MNQILIDLHNVLEKGNKIATEHERNLESLNNMSHDVKLQIELNKSKAAELSHRELVISTIENADKHMKAAKALMIEAKSKMDEFISKQAEFIKYRDEQNQLLNSKREDIRNEADGVERGRLAIEAEVRRRVDDLVSKIKGVEKAPEVEKTKKVKKA